MTPPTVTLRIASPRAPEEPHAVLVVVRCGLTPTIEVPLTADRLDALIWKLQRARERVRPDWWIIRMGNEPGEGEYVGVSDWLFDNQHMATRYATKAIAESAKRGLLTCRVVRLVPKGGS